MPVQLVEILKGFRELKTGSHPIIVHSSLKAIGHIEGGAQTVVNALLSSFNSVVVPTFTYKTMLIPRIGPDCNGITYGSGDAQNRMAEFFTPDMPADPMMGILPETLRKQPHAKRSMHPIQSFTGINADSILDAQTMENPLALLGMLAEQDGWVVLLGVDHTVNTSIHYAEKLAGRKQFIRWALTPQVVRECPGFPGCSTGFQVVAPLVESHVRRAKIGDAILQAVPLEMLFQVVTHQIKKDPLALLCQQDDCERCNEIRHSYS